MRVHCTWLQHTIFRPSSVVEERLIFCWRGFFLFFCYEPIIFHTFEQTPAKICEIVDRSLVENAAQKFSQLSPIFIRRENCESWSQFLTPVAFKLLRFLKGSNVLNGMWQSNEMCRPLVLPILGRVLFIHSTLKTRGSDPWKRAAKIC